MGDDVLRVRLSADGIQEVMDALTKVQGQVDKTKKSADGIGSSLRNELRDLGVAAAVQQLAAFVKSNIDAQAAVQDMVEVTGASAEAISVLGMAAAREGVGMEQLGKGTKAFTKFMGEVQAGAPEAIKALSDLGLSAQDLVGKGLDQQLVTVADAFNRFSDDGQSGMNKSAVAMKLFKKSGEDMRQVMQQLSGDQFPKLRAEGERTGQVLSGQAAQAAKETKLELAKLEGQIQGMTNAFSQGLIPELVSLGESFTNANDGGLSFFKMLGNWAGKTLKGVAGAFQLVGKGIAFVLGELLNNLEETAAKAGLYWDAIFGKAKIKDLPAAFDRVTAQFAKTRALQREAAGEDFWGGLDKLFPGDASKPAAPGSSAAEKAEEEKRKKQLKLMDEASQKALAASRAAGAKRLADEQKAELESWLAITEDLYKRGLIDLDTYLNARRHQIEAATASEVATLQAQVKAEIDSRTKGMSPAEKIASASKVADLRNQISIRQKQGEEQLNALERKGRDDREAGTEAALRAEADLAQAKGRTGEAGIKAIEAEYDKRIQMAKTEAERTALKALKGNTTASARLGDVSKDMDRGQQALNIGLGQIDNQQAQGFITEEEAVRKKIALYQEFIPVLEKVAEVQLEMAKATGNPDDLLKAQQNADGVQALKGNLRSLSESLAYVKNAARDAFQNGLADFIMSIGDQTTSLTEKFKALGKAILNAIAQAMAMRAATTLTNWMFGAPAKAEGGHILGPGTSTSDSIPAYLSNGEFVIKAAAVTRYGPGLFEALNGLRVPRFAQGGLVGSNAPEGFRSAPLIGEINITVDSQGKGSVSGDGSGLGMAQRMKQAVIAIILDESRPGGELARR